MDDSTITARLDAALVARLARPLVAPGVTDSTLGRRILGRASALTVGVTLEDEVRARYGRDEPATDVRPLVYAQPIVELPVTEQAARPTVQGRLAPVQPAPLSGQRPLVAPRAVLEAETQTPRPQTALAPLDVAPANRTVAPLPPEALAQATILPARRSSTRAYREASHPHARESDSRRELVTSGNAASAARAPSVSVAPATARPAVRPLVVPSAPAAIIQRKASPARPIVAARTAPSPGGGGTLATHVDLGGAQQPKESSLLSSASSAAAPQQPRLSTDSTPAPQQPRLSTDSTPAPQQPHLSTDSTRVPQQPRLSNDSAPTVPSIDIDAVVDRALTRLTRRLAVERERRGESR